MWEGKNWKAYWGWVWEGVCRVSRSMGINTASVRGCNPLKPPPPIPFYILNIKTLLLGHFLPSWSAYRSHFLVCTWSKTAEQPWLPQLVSPHHWQRTLPATSTFQMKSSCHNIHSHFWTNACWHWPRASTRPAYTVFYQYMFPEYW